MDNSPIEKIQSHEASSHKPKLVRYADTLKPGSSVLVRIIGSRGNNAYEGSVAGVRLIIHSRENLKPGDSFKGIIGLKNGTITITPAGTADGSSVKDISMLQIMENGGLFDPVTSPALTSLLSALNLSADKFSFNMLLQFKQLGMKMDPALMKKIRREAEKADDPQKKMEELVNKAQKKIASINHQGDCSGDLPGDNLYDHSENPENPGENHSFTEMQSMSKDDWLMEIKKFLGTITDGSLTNEAGELTILNHRGFYPEKTAENSWITLPFEITNPFEETTTGNGKIMILLGSSDKNFRQMNVHFNFKDTAWRFIINRNMTNISFSARGVPDAEEKAGALQNHFLQQGKTVHVQWVPFEKIDGTGALLEDFKLVEGHA